MGARIVVGLGNPGANYAAARHNFGFRVVEALAKALAAPPFSRRWEAEVCEVEIDCSSAAGGRRRAWLVKPMTYMNRSGETLRRMREALGEDFAVADLLVIADDINLPLGRMRFRAGGSDGGHRGLASIIAALATEDVPRLRLGVGAPAVRDDESVARWVLDKFTAAEEEIVAEVTAVAAGAVREWLVGDLAQCQNRYNGWRSERAQAV
ncbi:MAG: aminoacyl-tRNA hydrolase [Planctomycetota bacterium]|nr:aminoacyl-tRNA hydrolase [Planctomycetota bacterium]